MEILWLVIGAAIGLAATWFFLSRRASTHLADQEARFSDIIRRIQLALDRELGAHEATERRLLRKEEEVTANEERIAALDADLADIRKTLESMEIDVADKDLELARRQVRNEELEAQLDAVLAQARSDSEAAEGIRARLATLESRLLGPAGMSAREGEEAPSKKAREARNAAVEACKSQIADLESRLRDREAAIASLQAELADLRPDTADAVSDEP